QTQDAPDPEWFDVALRGSLGDRIARRDLKRAALKWQPSAFSMVRALGAAQLLVPPSRSGKGPESDLRCLRPRWLLSLLKARAANTLLQHSSLDWGRVLVAGQDTDRVILALLSAAQRGDFTPYFRILEDFDAEQFEAVAALEGATIACGLFLLTQGDLPEELSSGLAQFTAETAMVVGSELLPRSVQGDQAAAHFVVSTWQVAVACLCRELPFPLAHLDPFRSADPTRVRPFIAGAQRVIELKVARWAEPGVATPERATLGREIVGLLALLEDLLDAYAACASPAAAKELTPAYLQLVHSWNVGELFSRAQHSVPLFILVSYAETRGQSRAQILGALWQVLALEPALQKYFIPSTLTTPLSPADAEPHLEDDLYAQLWGQLPLSTLHLRLDAGLHIAWQHIRPHQFSAWINQSERGLDLPQPAAPYCPLDAVLARVDSHGPGAFSPATLATFVERAPGRFAERLTRYLADAEQ
ncbi:MAG TPA: hypothetical protein VN764_02515, partial [Polyangiaceae bacterium]|nr:hypothetical protein [Polyangiaceae bacterium]